MVANILIVLQNDNKKYNFYYVIDHMFIIILVTCNDLNSVTYELPHMT